MESGRLFFDSSCHGNMLLLGAGNPAIRGSRSFFNMEESSNKRAFFSSSDDLIGEEYYDEQLPEKKRRLTSEQVHLLEKSFETENKLEPERKTQLAKKLGLQPRQVAVWFQNRRARWKTKQLEREYDILKASYDSLHSDYTAIVKENEKLRSEVVSLTEKLQSKEVTVMELNQKSGLPLPANANIDTTSPTFTVKVEDRLSSGSGESAVVDEEYPQRVDSVDSYIPNNVYDDQCLAPVDRVQSEEDDISDDSPRLFSDVFAAADHNTQEEETDTLGWWVWS